MNLKIFTQTQKQILSILAIPLFSIISGCATYIPVPVVTAMPPGFLQVMQGGKRIAIRELAPAAAVPAEFQYSPASLAASTSAAIIRARYFRIIDTDFKTDSLDFDLTFSPEARKQIGSSTIDGTIVIQMNGIPAYNCQMADRYENRKECLKYEGGQCVSERTYQVRISSTSARVRLPIRAVLQHIESGELILFTTQAEAEKSQSVENASASCASSSSLLTEAIAQAGVLISQRFSPTVADVEILIDDSVDDVPEEKRSAVEARLAAARKYVEAGAFDFARDEWENALSESGDRSISALWNLGVYSWYDGDLEKAANYFQKAASLADAGYAKSGKRCLGLSGLSHEEIISKFNAERRRILLERNAEGIQKQN